MGNELNVPISELDGMKNFFNFSPGQVIMLKNQFAVVADENMQVNKQQFANIMKLPQQIIQKKSSKQQQNSPFEQQLSELDKIFQIFDPENTSKVDYFEWICALTLLSQTDFKTKTEIIFDLYDFNKSKSIKADEIVAMFKCIMTALNFMIGKPEVTIQEALNKKKEILSKYDIDSDGIFTLKEFQSFIKKESEILRILYNFNIISKDDMRLDFGDLNDLPECDSDLESEVQRGFTDMDEEKALIQERIKLGTFDKQSQKEIGFTETEPWRKTIKNLTPSDYKNTKNESNPPVVSLEIDYIYGYRSFDSRNNLKISNSGKLIYPIASVCIILNPETNQQQFYLEHTDDVICLDLYQNLIVSGQLSTNPFIAIWDCETQQTQVIIQGLFKRGINNVCFSNDGKKIAVADLDDNRNFLVFDYEKALQLQQKGQLNAIQNGMICSMKMSYSIVMDMKFTQNDQFVVIGCMREMYFINLEKQMKVLVQFDSPKIQSILSICVQDNIVVAGFFKGVLMAWKNHQLENRLQCHKGPINTIISRKSSKGFITAGNDLKIMILDQQLTIVKQIQLQSLKIANLSIISIVEEPKFNDKLISLIFGTRDSRIIQLNINENQEDYRTLMRGHYQGDLYGLVTHPKMNIFYTVGQDNMLGCWDIFSKKLIKEKKLEYPAQDIIISPNGRQLCIGCLNGSVMIIDPQTDDFKLLFYFLQIEQSVTCMKFSQDSKLLAVASAYPSCQISIYQVNSNFKLESRCNGSKFSVTHMDFSDDNKFLQVNNINMELLFFELQVGKLVTKVENMKDIKWSTYTCIFGWHVQGIWPQNSTGLDINKLDRTKNKALLALGDDFSHIKLFQYPAAKQEALYINYSLHSAKVTNIKFSSSDEYLISTGGKEKSIIQWKVNHNQIRQQHYDDLNQTIAEEDFVLKKQEEDENLLTEHLQYTQQIIEQTPIDFKSKQAYVDIETNLSLSGAIGVRNQIFNQDCRNSCKSINGKAVYPVSCLCVLADSKSQIFFSQHRQNICCLAIHPKRNIIATGSLSRKDKDNSKVEIYVWQSNDKTIIAFMNDFHKRAIVAMEFNHEGNILLTAGQDEGNSIALYDWANSRLITTAKVDKMDLNGLAWKYNSSVFMTVGLRHVKLWNIKGRNLNCSFCFIGKKFEPQISIAWSDPNSSQGHFITGGLEGNLYLWEGDESFGPVSAHQGKINSIIALKNKTILTAGNDGKVKQWQINKNTISFLVIQADLVQGGLRSGFGIISLAITNENNDMLICTKSCELYEQKFDLPFWKPSICYTKGHYSGQITCAAFSLRSLFITSGGDKILRIWDVVTRKEIYSSPMFEYEIKALDWSNHIPKDKIQQYDFIIAADINCDMFIFEINSLNNLIEADKRSAFFQSMKDKKKRKINFQISYLKISPNCQMVAVGAIGAESHLEIWQIAHQKFGKGFIIDLGFYSGVNCFDWSYDSSIIGITSQSQEYKYISVEKKEEIAIKQFPNIKWQTFSLNYTWYTQGLIKSSKGSIAVSLAQSENKKLIVAGLKTGEIQLYSFPIVYQNQICKKYFSHSTTISSLKWSINDKYLISLGGEDRTILIWETDYSFQIEQMDALDQLFQQQYSQQKGKNEQDNIPPSQQLKNKQIANSDEVEYQVQLEQQQLISKIELIQPKIRKYGSEKFGKIIQKNYLHYQEESKQEKVPEKTNLILDLPWSQSISPPSTFYKDPNNHLKPPRVKIHLHHVFGYRVKGSTNNIKILKQGDIIYPASNLVVIMSLNEYIPSQTFFKKHKDDVTVLDMHPDGIKVASAETRQGNIQQIYIWDSGTLNTIADITIEDVQGISCLQFSPLGEKLAALCIDRHHKILVYDITVKNDNGCCLLAYNYVGINHIQSLKWKNEQEIGICGFNYFQIWIIYSNCNLRCKDVFYGINNNQICKHYLCMAASSEDYFLGMLDGTIQIFKNEQLLMVKQDFHKKMPVDTIEYICNLIISGGRDGRINIWDRNYNFILKIETNIILEKTPFLERRHQGFKNEIRSVTLSQDQKTLIVGTSDAEIYELQTKDVKISNSTKFVVSRILMQAPFAPNQNENDLWALDCSKNKDLVGICGSDAIIRIYQLSNKKLVNMQRTNEFYEFKSKEQDIQQEKSSKEDDNQLNEKVIKNNLKSDEAQKKQKEILFDIATNDIYPDYRPRCMAFSNNGDFILVGFRNGSVKLYTKELELVKHQLIAKDAIQIIKFNAIGDTVALGSLDNAIYLFKFPDLASKCKPMRKFLSVVDNLDFSIDGNYLHSTCVERESIYWQTQQGIPVNDPKILYGKIKNEKWLTRNCTLSWHTQGIWGEYESQTDILCDRSNHTYSGQEHPPDNYQLLATADDESQIKIFRYPCNNQQQQYVQNNGHSSFISRIKWSSDDQYIFTTGCEDNCLFVWKVTKY